jgi:hypothetical protein
VTSDYEHLNIIQCAFEITAPAKNHFFSLLLKFRIWCPAMQAVDTTSEPTLYEMALDLNESFTEQKIGKKLQVTLIEALEVRVGYLGTQTCDLS